MDIRKVKKLIELLEDSALLEIEIKEGEESIRLSRASSSTPQTSVAPTPFIPVESPAPAPAPMEVGAVSSIEPKGHVVKSPMVGTFYASPTPDSTDFVAIGSRVEIGEKLCILEAMKIFNPIEADCAGSIKAVYKQNGDPVEYGEALFLIE